MFRTLFGVIAGLVVGTTASSASTAATGTAGAALSQRIAQAQVTIGKLEALTKGSEPTQASEAEGETRVVQHWHDHHHPPWHNWNNWDNWHNHWGNHHH